MNNKQKFEQHIYNARCKLIPEEYNALRALFVHTLLQDKYVESNPDIKNGQLVLKNTEIPIYKIIENVVYNSSSRAILEKYYGPELLENILYMFDEIVFMYKCAGKIPNE